MKPPLILITPSTTKRGVEFEDNAVSLSNQYSLAIAAGGGLPWIMPALPARSLIAESVARCDGVLLTGGDEPDPVQIGGTTTYTLVVTNQGNITLTNVKLNCSMEDGESMAFVSAEGNPTKATNSGKAVTFAPLATLAPKASATYKIVVRAVKEGQVSFRSEASSDQITRALIKTETTNFYK